MPKGWINAGTESLLEDDKIYKGALAPTAAPQPTKRVGSAI